MGEAGCQGEELIYISWARSCTVRRSVNRFVVEVADGSNIFGVHINNTGRLQDVLVEGRKGFCIPTRRGKLGWRLFSVWYYRGYSIIDTLLQEESFRVAVEKGLLPWAQGCSVRKRSPRVGRSVFDWMLECGEEPVFVEMKSAVLGSRDGYGMYPDCPSLRGRRHIELLIDLAKRGKRAWIVFIVAFPGARGFRPYREGDPEIYRLLWEAQRAGVELYSFGVCYDPESSDIRLYSSKLPIDLG